MRSTDAGLSWGHALPPPHHIVAASPFVYKPAGPQSVLFGFRSPSNIIRSVDGSGYYYAFILAGWSAPVDPAGQKRGECLFRTRDITDPAAWRAWDGTGFSVRLDVNPYLDPTLDPADHICEVNAKQNHAARALHRARCTCEREGEHRTVPCCCSSQREDF